MARLYLGSCVLDRRNPVYDGRGALGRGVFVPGPEAWSFGRAREGPGPPLPARRPRVSNLYERSRNYSAADLRPLRHIPNFWDVAAPARRGSNYRSAAESTRESRRSRDRHPRARPPSPSPNPRPRPRGSPRSTPGERSRRSAASAARSNVRSRSDRYRRLASCALAPLRPALRPSTARRARSVRAPRCCEAAPPPLGRQPSQTPA